MDHFRRSARNCFVAPIDRVTGRRRDEGWIADRLADPASRFVVVWKDKFLLAEAPGSGDPRAALLSRRELEGCLLNEPGPVVLLGQMDGRVVFALGLREEDDAPPAELAGRGEFHSLRRAGALLAQREGALLAYAKAMVHWHRHHSYCGTCGSPTESVEGGHLRVCTHPDCGQHHFPRTDPAIIVLVTSGGRCLLGRQPWWTAGMYATIAGFVEPGESLEAAVAREVMEETGVPVQEVIYQSSQPWPFPRSIMLGFRAVAAGEEITLGDGELEDARWFSRQEIVRGLGDGWLRLPSAVSISYRLIEDWFDGGGAGRLSEVLAAA